MLIRMLHTVNRLSPHSTSKYVGPLLPCPDVVGGDDGFSGPAEQAGQVEALVLAGLHIVTELDHHDVGHGVSILRQKFSSICIYIS